MKKLMFSLAAVVVVVFVSCGEKKAAVQSNQEELDEALEYMYRDSTIYGTCTDGSTMNTLQMLTDNGDTLTLSTLAAQESNCMFGQFANGDRMAVVANEKHTQALIVINLNTLLGDWVMPNPLDGTSYMGFTIKDGGIAESINQTSIVYKTWRINNGNLQMVSVREGGGDFVEDETYKFLYLSADSMSLQGTEEVFDYVRPVVEENYDGVIIDEEDENFEDMVI